MEEQLWPAFGSNSETYEGLRSFWGDDIVSNLFANVLGAIGKVSTPFLQDEVVPRWNEAMEPEVNRQALFGALAVILGVVAKEWAKDAYLLLRRSSRPRSDG